MYCSGHNISGLQNSDLERRKELERRKKLRLLQVRQQSKEFADNLREKIKGAIVKQKTKYVEAENKLKQKQHLEELYQLKELYDKCLQSIGNGHKEAAKQPDISAEKKTKLDNIFVQAATRGHQALRKKHEDEAVLKQKQDASLKQRKSTRNKENLRALFISSLPQQDENYRVNSNSPPKEHNQNTEQNPTRRVLAEIPSNIIVNHPTVPEIKKCKSFENQIANKRQPKSLEGTHEDVVVHATKPTNSSPNTSLPRECSCDYIVCSCHRSPRELRRCSSESKLSCENVFDFDEPAQRKVRRRSYSPRSVRTLNYLHGGNVYESNQPSTVRVTHHSRSPKKTEEVPKSNTGTVEEAPISKQSTEELKKRADERSAKALKKEQLKKDFQQLIQNLRKLSQEKSVNCSKTKVKRGVFPSERDIQFRKGTKQKKLDNAFENLPHLTHPQNTGAYRQKQNQFTSEDCSPPTLNLASCQRNMISGECMDPCRRAVSDISLSGTPSGYGGCQGLGGGKPRRGRSESPSVDVRTDPTGDIHITVKVSELQGQSPGRKRSPCSDSSYMSPPSNLTPSQQQLINELLKQVNNRTLSMEIKKYIEKLLKMNQDSIAQLHEQSQSPNVDVREDLAKLSQLTEVYGEKVGQLVDMYEQFDSPSSPGGYVDPIRGPQGSGCSPMPSCPPRGTAICHTSPSLAARPITCPSPATRSQRSLTPKCTPTSSQSKERIMSSGIRESPEHSYQSSHIDDSLIQATYGGIPGFRVPTKQELCDMTSFEDTTASDLPPDFDLTGWFNEKRRKIIGDSPGQQRLIDNCSTRRSSVSRESDIASRVEELKLLQAGIDTILEGVASTDELTVCAEELPLQTSEFGCGLESLLSQEPTLQGSNQVDFLGEGSMLCNELRPDTGNNLSIFQFPLNHEKLNVLRQELINTCKGELCDIPFDDCVAQVRPKDTTIT